MRILKRIISNNTMAEPEKVERQHLVADRGLTQAKIVDPQIKIVETLLNDVPDLKLSFDVLRKIGEGTFSKVYQARMKSTNEYCALKHIVPTSHPTRIANELKYMLRLGNKRNVMGVLSGLVCKGNVVIVMPYFYHNRFSDYVLNLTILEIQDYMKNLLLALEWIHSAGVIHRDLKPSNFLFYRKIQRYALVDFGLAQNIENQIEPKSTSSFDMNVKSKDFLPVKTSGKRMSNNDLENNSLPHKRPCYENPVARVLQPLVNRINVTVHPVGSDAIKKPTVPFLKQVLGMKHNETSNALIKKSNTPTKEPQKKCNCFGKRSVCKICLSKKSEIAPRAGTPGFRAPEVLMRYKPQTTAIDIWSAGVIFLSLLSRRYPFFTASEDMTALAEITAIFGTQRMKNVAHRIGKLLTIGCEKPTLDLGMLCTQLRSSVVEKDVAAKYEPSIPESAITLLYSLLELDPQSRISAKNALKHPFFKLK